MSGYRCVNYYELCRLCTSSNGSKVNIFSEENKRKNLSSKIIDVLPVLHLDEKDKLPKIICTQCLQNIESYAEFRETSINAQNMLQSCLNSTKLCNGGQVYIKDASVKKAVAAPQTLTITSPLKNEISLTPIANSTATLMTPTNEFLTSIIQGIQQSEENEVQNKMAVTQQLTSGQNTQFRITFDSNSVKNGNQVQYKIQQEQPTTSHIATAASTSTNEQNLSTFAQVNEFLKLKTTPNVAQKRPEPAKPKPEPKLKKPKMQLLTTPVKTATKIVQQPQQQLQQQPQQQPQQQQIQIQKTSKSTTIAMPIKTQVQTLPQQTSPLKSTPLQFQDIKFVSAANKCMVPLVLKNSSDATQQIFTQFATTSDAKPVAYLQMKIEPNSDGQPCVQLTPTQMPATLQLTSQQLQQFGFQQFQPAQIQTQQSQNSTSTQQFQVFTPQTIAAPITTTASTTLQTNTTASQTQTVDEPDDDGDYGDDTLMEVSHLDTSDEVEEVKPRVEKPAAQTRKKNSPMSVQQNTATSSASARTYSTLSQIPKHQSALASKQLDAISLHKDLTTPAKAVVVNENQEPVEEIFSLTKCQVCGKEFKKKEHCMQHLKTHIGLRPFVCQDKSGCNKSFNRKEHLLRHVVSHTGKKMFNCDLCHKYFSRKDNLNKHRRTHPEAGAVTNMPYQCEVCERSFVAKSQYLKHKLIHENQSSDNKEDDEHEPTPATNDSKTPKNRNTGKSVPIRKVKQEPTETKNDVQPQEQQQPSQPPALQIIKQQQPQQQTTQHTNNAQISAQIHPQIIQILPSMMSTSNAQTITINQQDHQQQQPKTTIIKTLNADGNTTVYTIPSNLIINPAQFMTAGEMMGNFKIENAN